MLSKPGTLMGAGLAGVASGPVWTPISWDNFAGTGTLVAPGNGALTKTAGVSDWDCGAWSNQAFAPGTAFQMRFKAPTATISALGFLTQGTAPPTNFFKSHLQVQAFNDGRMYTFDNGDFVDITPTPNGYGTNDPAQYWYVKVSAAGVMTVWQGTTLKYTYADSVAGLTLVPYCGGNSISTLLTESAYLLG